MDGIVVLPAQPGAEADGQRHGTVMVKFDMAPIGLVDRIFRLL
jgi:hypothetical protein